MQFVSTLIGNYKSECQRRLLKGYKFQWTNHERQLNGYVALLFQTSTDLQDKQQKTFDLSLLVDKPLELKICPLIPHELNKRLEKILVNRIDEILVGYKETLDYDWATDQREFSIQQVHANLAKNQFCRKKAIIHTIRISPNSSLLVEPPIAQSTLTLTQHLYNYLAKLANLPHPKSDRDSSDSDGNGATRTFLLILVESNTQMTIESYEKIEKGSQLQFEFVGKWSNYQALFEMR